MNIATCIGHAEQEDRADGQIGEGEDHLEFADINGQDY